MALRLIPKDEKFFDLFEVQASNNVNAAKKYKDLVEKWDLDSPIFDELRDMEHEADITTHELIDKLNRTFVTPFDREDIHALASKMDDIIDMIQSLSVRMKLYRIDQTSDELKQLTDILWQCTENIKKALPLLREPNRYRSRILDYCIEINRLENAGDQVLHASLGKLFHDKSSAQDLLKWKEIYEVTEATIDKCEDVANAIEAVVVKQA